MIEPLFTFDAEANAYISEPVTIEAREAIVEIKLVSPAPVVTLKKEDDGGYGNYGESPEQRDAYKIKIVSRGHITVKLSTPVNVIKCIIY
jgi:hypothetical protein